MISYRIVSLISLEAGLALYSSKNNVKSWSYFQKAEKNEEKLVAARFEWEKSFRASKRALKKRNKRNKVIDLDNRTLSFLLHTKGDGGREERRILEMTIHFMNNFNFCFRPIGIPHIRLASHLSRMVIRERWKKLRFVNLMTLIFLFCHF